MIELTCNDFQPLANFELRERWIGSQKDTLPEKTLNQFQPLTSTKAIELWNYTSRYRNELWSYAFKNVSDPLPETSSFTSMIRIDANSEGIERTTKKLMSLGLSHDELVIVMWEPEVAMRIPWDIFCYYWSDLCFPSSDDVSICPISETWFLQYHHEDRFIFGKIRADLPAFRMEEPPVGLDESMVDQDEILRLLQADERIAAIKLYQKETGIPFKAAIEAIEKLSRDIHT